MAVADNILTNCTLFIDNIGYAGNVDTLQLPNLTLKTEEHRGAGMDAPIEIDMGMEKMEASFTLSGYDETALSCFGENAGERTFTIRGALRKLSGEVVSVVAKMNGLVKTLENGEWKPGEKATLNLTLAVTYYEYTHGGRTIHNVDPANMQRIINGTDQLSAIRSALNI